MNVRAQSGAPVIDSFSPQKGAPGDPVVIRGHNFGSFTSLVFTGGASAMGEYDSRNITATVPAGAKTGPLEVICTGYPGAFSAKSFVVTAPGPTPVPTPSLRPVITSATTASGAVGQPFSYQIAADRAVTHYAAGNLPAGLSVDQASGLISGTPMDFGVFGVKLEAANAYGIGISTMTLSISVDTPVVSATAAPNTVEAATGQKAKIRFSMSYAVPRDTFVAFTIHGTARVGIDFGLRHVIATTDAYFVTIPAGQTHASVKLDLHAAPANPLLPAGTVLVARFKLQLFHTLNHPVAFRLGSPRSAVVKIIEP